MINNKKFMPKDLSKQLSVTDRSDTILAKTCVQYDAILINKPMHSQQWVLGCALLLVFLLLILLYVPYAEQCMVQGVVGSTPDLVHVYAPQAGVMTQRAAKVGDHVLRGAPLFTMRLLQLHGPLEPLLHIQEIVEKNIAEKTAHIARLQPLLQHKDIAHAVYQQEVDALHVLQQEEQRIVASIKQEKQKESYVVTSPIEGTLLQMGYNSGQFLDTNKKIVSLLPKDARLQVSLYLPVISLRFAHTNYPVVLRYDAYPYAQFGVATGVIEHIGEIVLTDAEDNKSLQIGVPYYKVLVRLDNANFLSDKQNYPLHYGMTLHAILTSNEQSLGKWLLHHRL